MVGGIGAVIALFAYRFATGIPTFMEALAERMIRLLPYQVFALVLEKLQHLAKPLGFVMAIVTSIIGFGIGGVLYAWASRQSTRPRLVLGLLTALITWVFLTYVFLPFIEGGILGIPLTTVVPAPALPMAIASLVYGLVLAALAGRPSVQHTLDRLASRPPVMGGSDPMDRRDLLRLSALAVLGAAAGTRLAAWAARAGTRLALAAGEAFRLLKGMPPEVTPNDQWYQVSKNFFDPTVDVNKWKLDVTGLVDKELHLSFAEFTKAAPPVERYQTFECISNEVGGDLISNAKWKGLRVKDLLDLAGVKPGATTVIWRAADGFSESIALPIALDPETLLAYEMNGVPIPQKHGAPVRVLLLNRYGMKQPKWLVSIEVANHDYTGYWEQQGWSKEAIVKTNSAFRVEMKEDGMVALGGWAYAGDRGISKVEFSPDDGKTWTPAAVKAPLGENTWQFWSAEWAPPGPGEYTFKVRATDGKGSLQPAQPEPTLPDGGQGYHTVHVHV
jgi:DMSO/TMAO reductase YedYZ molybdopterin-dependent catalytic subunit